jgi:Transcription factor WhiB
VCCCPRDRHRLIFVDVPNRFDRIRLASDLDLLLERMPWPSLVPSDPSDPSDPSVYRAWVRLTELAVASPPPCQSDPELWFAKSREDVSIAVELCSGCHALSEYGQYAEASRQAWGVWGARDRTARRRPDAARGTA